MGGSLGTLAAGKLLDEAIKFCHTLSTVHVVRVEPQYKGPKVN